MSRSVTNGKYIVPKEVSALKPKGISCNIKVIPNKTKTAGVQKYYYVYESTWTGSGKVIGKIENGKFCPNARGIKLLGENREEKPNPTVGETETNQKDQGNDWLLSDKELEAVRSAAADLDIDTDDIVPQCKAYGEYAVVLACTGEVLRKLENRFSAEDARLIYALSVICFVEEYIFAGSVKDALDTSILSNTWPGLAMDEQEVGYFLKLLGQHPATCDSFSQDLIDASSGLTAIDGGVVLMCPKQNDLTDYENIHQRITNDGMNVLQAYDAVNEVPLASTAYYGDVVDKSVIQNLLAAFRFPERTTFLMDKGFYSEEALGLYREGGKHFVIPVPESAAISKAMRSSVTFTDCFAYTKTDESGAEHKDAILYRESTVRELEDLYLTILEEKTERASSRKTEGSVYGEDRVIMFRDEDIHGRMLAGYRSEIGTEESDTEEELSKLGSEFGLMILRTNLPKDTVKASALYADYKKRWTRKTQYNFTENAIRFWGLQTSDYCTMQGLSFLMIPVGQIKAAFVKRMASASANVRNLSIGECLNKARCFRAVRGQDGKWRISMASKEKIDLLREMGVDVAEDIKKLNMSQR